MIFYLKKACLFSLLFSLSNSVLATNTEQGICPIQLDYMNQSFPLENAAISPQNPLVHTTDNIEPKSFEKKLLWDDFISVLNYSLFCYYQGTKSQVIFHLDKVKQCESTQATFPHINCEYQ